MFLGISQNEFTLFLLVFTRITSALVVFPVFNSTTIPTQMKIGSGLAISLLTLPLLKNSGVPVPADISHLILNLSAEVLVGLILGFLASLVFAGVELAGQLISIQMGFGIVNVYDPQTSRQIPIVGQFYSYLAMMIFLAIDGHHFLLEGLFQSFKTIPLSAPSFKSAIVELNVTMMSSVFVSAIKIGVPVIVTLLLTSIALGLVARAVPQMNVFFVGMPLKIGMGLLALSFSLPLFAYVFRNIFIQFQTEFFKLLRLLGK